jgi:hypothetical protein
MKSLTTPSGQNSEILTAKSGATYSYQCASKCSVVRITDRNEEMHTLQELR